MDLKDELRRWGRCLQVGGLIALCLAIGHSGREVVASLAATPFAGAGWLDLINAGLTGLVHALPYLLLLDGLYSISRLGGRYQSGEIFSPDNALLIRRFGASLVATAAAFMVIRPTILDWIGGVTRGFSVNIDEAAIAILLAGVFVAAMAQVMTLAGRIQAENDSFI